MYNQKTLKPKTGHGFDGCEVTFPMLPSSVSFSFDTSQDVTYELDGGWHDLVAKEDGTDEVEEEDNDEDMFTDGIGKDTANSGGTVAEEGTTGN